MVDELYKTADVIHKMVEVLYERADVIHRMFHELYEMADVIHKTVDELYETADVLCKTANGEKYGGNSAVIVQWVTFGELLFKLNIGMLII